MTPRSSAARTWTVRVRNERGGRRRVTGVIRRCRGSRSILDQSSVRVLPRKAEAPRGALLRVELDEHGGLVAHHPRVVPRLDRDHLRRDVLERAAVAVRTLDVALGEEADVRVHAEPAVDRWPHVRRPAKAGWIDGALHPSAADADDVDLGTADLAVVGSLDGCGERVHASSLLGAGLGSGQSEALEARDVGGLAP